MLTFLAVLAGIFHGNADTADLMFCVAWLALWIIGAISIVQKSLLPGLGYIALGFIPLGYLFLTP